jgi:hypothetical protein
MSLLKLLNTKYHYHGKDIRGVPVCSGTSDRQLPRLASMQNLCTQLNVDGATLQRVAEEQGIKPRYNINGQDFYEITDFGDAATLLRASSASVSQRETWLRPAAQTETPPELLLRASDTKPPNDNQGGK